MWKGVVLDLSARWGEGVGEKMKGKRASSCKKGGNKKKEGKEKKTKEKKIKSDFGSLCLRRQMS